MNDFLVIKVRKEVIENGNGEMLLAEAKNYLDKQPDKKYHQLRKSLTIYLNNKGKRQTQERYKVLEKICSHGQIFSIKDIHAKVLEDFQVSIKTVNSAFALLENAGIIKPIIEIREKFKPTYFEITPL